MEQFIDGAIYKLVQSIRVLIEKVPGQAPTFWSARDLFDPHATSKRKGKTLKI